MRSFFLVLCLVAVALAKKHHAGHKKVKVPQDVVEEGVADLAEAKEALDKLTYTKEEQVMNVPAEEPEQETGYHNTINNPCADIDCGPGQVCALSENDWSPYCKCMKACPTEEKEFNICSSQNITYASYCEFYRQKCGSKELAKVLVEYYGPCKEMEPCQDKEMAIFPQRMREWFREVMFELSNRPVNEGGLSDDEVDEEREAERDPNPFMRPIHWNFRRLDTNPADLYLTHEELTSIRAPLIPQEHCTKPFFTQCDKNQDGLISLQEWGLCLGLTAEEIQY